MMLPTEALFHRNDHGHRFHVCHHERCKRDRIDRHSRGRLNAAARLALIAPKPMTIAQARLA